ncbi:hypothetical protein NKOR_05910 [Candidatus Nitrosopumilus koreensis AR1]|uniref:AsnC family transcriptional regulator n=1 Tax=Candidatus Nitrosopumilus koreensis AR1 TaxID=1229908 RepID=K0B7Y0_9ARCH|nr:MULTISPECIES: hypothetical protein [Nitrosopumilus]AFS81065.1 hypothetical protein NKOR_05910 [Candidatus Nitrosopumilus koreensis AR1]
MDFTYLLISCTPTKNVDVANTLQELSGVKEAVPVHGAFDCIVKTEKMPSEDVSRLVISSIRPLDDVRSILPLRTAPLLVTS